MIDCDKAKELLNDYLDGSLDPGIKNDLDQHLEIHPECRELFEHSTIIKKSLADIQNIKVSDNFDASLRHKVGILNNQKEKTGFVRKHRTFSFAFSATALASVLFALVFFDFDDPAQTQENPVIQSSSVSGSLSKSKNTQSTENEADQAIEDSLKQGVNSFDKNKLKLTGDDK